MFGLLFILLIIVIYFYTTRNHSYWAKKNVKHDPPIPIFGNHFRNVFGIKSTTELNVELYRKYKDEKVVGYYKGAVPELIIRDLDIVRAILTVNFDHFYPRGLGRDPEKEPMLSNLFHIDGDKWKLLRQRLTPAFTTAKLKAMFPLIVNCAKKLQVVGTEYAESGENCDVREIMARFTTEFIAACGFGIEVNTINKERSMFRELGQKMFSRSWKNLVLLGLWDLFPELRPFINTKELKIEEAITAIVKSICEQRNFKNSGRNDFIDLLLDLQEKGVIKGESIEKRNPDGTPIPVEMTMEFPCLVAQVFVFFAAGFETSSSATSYTLLQLAYNQDKQRKVQEEIDTILSKYNDELCYDSIAEMKYLSMAFKEAMRKFPSLGTLNRTCVKRYTLPGTDITIDPGVRIQIPIQAIQTDEKYFENPDQFVPERFEENNQGRHHFSYLPFGEGPRACIGARLGEMQSLAGLAALLQKFSVEPSDKSQPEPVVNHTSNVVQAVIGGIPLKIVLRKKNM